MTQLDLFTPEAPPARSPFVCPWCRREEPNELLLWQNHWVGADRSGYDWAAENGRCAAQHFTRNHVAYDVSIITHGSNWDRSCCGVHRTYQEACARATLAMDAERARALGVDVSDLLALVGAS